MALIGPDVIFRRLAQIFRIRPIVYHGVMVVIASRIIGSPSDNGDVVVGNFERWPFDDLDMQGPRRRRRMLSAAAGLQKTKPPAKALTPRFGSSLFIDDILGGRLASRLLCRFAPRNDRLFGVSLRA